MKNANTKLNVRIMLRGMMIDSLQKECETQYGKDSVTAKSQTIKAQHGIRVNRLLYGV